MTALGPQDIASRAMAFQAPWGSSVDAAFRKLVREAIRRGPFTKSECDVTLALVNLWFHHRNGPKGFIHPGREHLAKKAGVTVKTVSRALTKLRDAGAAVVVARPKGEGQRPTEYRIRIYALLDLCGYRLPEWISGEIVPLNVPPLGQKMSHHWREKMSHSLTDVGGPIPWKGKPEIGKASGCRDA